MSVTEFLLPDPRPLLDGPLELLLQDLVRLTPTLSPLPVREILVVAASAHGSAAASIRSLDGCAADVVVDGYRRRWELALRPPFFLEGDATRRLGTLMHELLHLDTSRPGQLLECARHENRSHAAHEELAVELANGWLKRGDLSLLAPLGHCGEVKIRQWKIRPIPATVERRFTDADLFYGTVQLMTPREHRTVWW